MLGGGNNSTTDLESSHHPQRQSPRSRVGGTPWRTGGVRCVSRVLATATVPRVAATRVSAGAEPRGRVVRVSKSPALIPATKEVNVSVGKSRTGPLGSLESQTGPRPRATRPAVTIPPPGLLPPSPIPPMTTRARGTVPASHRAPCARHLHQGCARGSLLSCPMCLPLGPLDYASRVGDAQAIR